MNRVIVFWDFSNFDIALRRLEPGYPREVRLDFQRLVQAVVGDGRLVKVYFATSAAPGEDADDLRKFFDAVDRFPYFYVKTFDRAIGASGETHEKQVDTYLATQIVALAYENAYDEAILISGDSDLIPAVEIAQQKGKVVTVVASRAALSDELKRRADKFVLIDGPKRSELLGFMPR